jgi:hypothetical protein
MTETEKVLMEEIKSLQVQQTMLMLYISENEMVEDYTRWATNHAARITFQVPKP